MSSDFWRRVRRAFAAIALSWLAASPTLAETYVGAGVGVLVPYEGGTGWTLMGEIGTDWTNKWVRVGAEFVFSNLDQGADLTSVGLPPVEVRLRTYELNFVTRYVMFPGRISPYLGVGGGFIFIDVDDGKLKQALGVPPIFQSGSTTGIGGGLLGLVGLEIPLFSKSMNLFAEARVDYYWEFTSNLKPLIDEKNYNGFSGIGGLRMRF
ncbi:MAG: outer membrane beta-barrel protein [Deltaproteobacteria bacterium]|jgi:hypothetical protein|nr:outer membrane beta-barrel protein [Deltaproteobacteria bacterium]MBW2385312.1 outer membrane beta-barrel protein [Deltaproteobacteria bacterium]